MVMMAFLSAHYVPNTMLNTLQQISISDPKVYILVTRLGCTSHLLHKRLGVFTFISQMPSNTCRIRNTCKMSE